MVIVPCIPLSICWKHIFVETLVVAQKIIKMIKLFRNVLFVCLIMSCVAGFAQTSPDQTAGSNEKAVRTVYTAYEKKDWNMLNSVLAEGFTFSSPVNVPPIDIKQYKESC
jgi:hypothetical protein